MKPTTPVPHGNAAILGNNGGVLRASFALAMVSLLLFGLAYSLAGTALGRVLFPRQAAGSLVERDGKIVGSSLVAQPFAGDGYFQPRPSAAGYDLMALASSNQARSNPDMRRRVQEAVAAVAAREGVRPEDVPGDLATQSGGGADPHISPQAARIQIARVSKARGLPPARVQALVDAHTQKPQFGLLGLPRVDVLQLNLALDAAAQAAK